MDKVDYIKSLIDELGFWDLMRLSLYEEWLMLYKYWYVWVAFILILVLLGYSLTVWTTRKGR